MGLPAAKSPKRSQKHASRSRTTAQPSDQTAKPHALAQSGPVFSATQWTVLAILAVIQFMHIVDFMVVMPLTMSLGSVAALLIIVAPPGQPIKNYLSVGVLGIIFNIAAIYMANTFKGR